MPWPQEHSVRPPAVAGTFYPAQATECRSAAQALLDRAPAANAAVAPASRAADSPGVPSGVPGSTPPEPAWSGGIVPHAGWMCSGLIAAQTIVTLRRARPNVDVVVVFGAIHTPIEIDRAALDSFAVWSEPSGMTPAAGELRERLSASSPLFHTDDRFHRREHAVEVELPLIQLAWPTASVLAIQTPPNERAVEIGRQTARSVAAAGLRAVYLASSDLTHYGPAYQFSPAGVGISALDWAMENDRRVLQFVTSMRPETIVPEVRRQRNACGAGAIAAMMAACMENGATAARLLRHANSFETLSEFVQQRPDNAVGYAAMVVG